MPNFVTPYRGPELREGMTIAIEPMITAGEPEVYVHDDEWSISTVDGSLAAHFEHTVAITERRPASAHESRTGPGTMTTSRQLSRAFLCPNDLTRREEVGQQGRED